MEPGTLFLCHICTQREVFQRGLNVKTDLVGRLAVRCANCSKRLGALIANVVSLFWEKKGDNIGRFLNVMSNGSSIHPLQINMAKEKRWSFVSD